MKYLLYQIEFRRWLIMAVVVAFVIHLLPLPPGLTGEGQSVLGIVAMTVLLVLFEPVPLPVIALLIVVLEVVFRVASTADVAHSFMSDSVIFIAGSLMLAVAVVRQQLDKRILYFLLRITRSRIAWTTFALVTLSSLMASVMGEHSVAAILLPVALILVRVCRQMGGALAPVQPVFLMSVAYGCAIASVGSPSGGARNAIMISYWQNLSQIQVGYLEWMLYMYPLVLVQIPFLYLLLRIRYKMEPVLLQAAYVELEREFGSSRKLRIEDWITISIVIVTLFLWVFFSHDLGLGPIALIGVLLCILTGVLHWEQINSDLNWGIILLYASIISLGLWMDQTGAAAWIAEGIQFTLQAFRIEGGFFLLVVYSLLGMLAGSILSTGPAIAILGPIVLKQAQIAEVSPLVLGMVMVASTSYANFTPVSSPACTIVYGSGMLERKEFLRLGIPVGVVSLVIILLAASFYWPLLEGLY